MGEDLRHLPQVLAHSRRARRIMMQNIAISLAIITILIPLAALGILGLATVVFIHEFAEVLVILNAIRAARTHTLPGVTTAPHISTAHSVDIGPAPTHLDATCCGPVSPTPTAAIALSLELTDNPACGVHGCGCCAPDTSATAVNRANLP